jgi:regulator of protease activity HflC (stomatin/prohibitin superfamily)
MNPAAALLFPVLFFLFVLLTRSIRQVNQWEVGLKFTLGKFDGRMEPGLNFLIPIIQTMIRIDTRIRNRDLPKQMVITADNVTAMIDAVVYYKVVDPEKAALNVQDFELAVKDRARVVLRDIVGEIRLDELLEHREEVAQKVRTAVEQFVSQWGLHVELIALQDIQLPPQMQEVLARKAIAERDRQYVLIKSQADVESARNFAEAARILVESPGAMELRRLEALQNLTASGTSKVIFDLARPYHDTGAAAMAAAMADDQRSGVRVDAVHPPAQQALGQEMPSASNPAFAQRR